VSARPVRVYINGRFLTQPTTGVQRGAREIVRALDELAGGGELVARRDRFTILAPNDARLDLPLRWLPLERVGRLRGHAWEQLELPRYARGGLLVSFGNTGPLLASPQVVMIHDASVFAVPFTYSTPFRLWYRFLLPRLGRRASNVLTSSRFSRDELSRLAGIPPAKLRVVPLGKEHILEVDADATVLTRHGIGDRPFVLAVGSRSPHKNFHVISRAMEMLGGERYDFVLVGGTNARSFSAAAAGAPPFAKAIGYVTDGELRALYQRAACFVFPSLYEGFGLPPLEAMACGCPVITSRAASLPEVCGDAALYFDPHDSADLARRIGEVMESAPLREELSRRGLERARHFCWRESGRAVLRVVDELRERGGGGGGAPV
jgi:glycosyltransferase involved in cell wall biosynthesis